MNVLTITCHDVYNYGASLQAYALQHYCESLGCKYHIIDYKPDYLSGHYSLTAVANPRFDKPLIKQLYLLAKMPSRLAGLRRKKRFDAFTTKYLNITSRRFNSCQEIAGDCPPADLYIAGSDQIWNTLFKNGRDAAFYLDFVENRGRKISYAASFATERIYNDAEPFVVSRLRNFDAISVRESSALKLLENLGRTDGILVCDPVFLLSAADWRKMIPQIPQSIKEDYILVYDCERSERLREMALRLKSRTGLPIYVLSPTFGRYADNDLSLSGPIEFLMLMANAKYVVANSFHALAFSIIFEKDFYIINRSENINTRMGDFLSYLGTSERLIFTPQQLTLEPVDFSRIRPTVDAFIRISKVFLNHQISLCQ